MQTNPFLWHLVYIKPFSAHRDGRRRPLNLRVNMSKTATFAIPASDTPFGRLLARIDALLMAWAESNIRNGDVPRFGV
jgi:hypothetical protein